MMKKAKTSLNVTVFILLFLLNILLQMLLSGEPLGRYFVTIFTSFTGIFQFIGAVFYWFYSYFFTRVAFYLAGVVIAMEFLVLPLMVRYRYITFKPNLFVSILAAFYIWLAFRIMMVVFS